MADETEGNVRTLPPRNQQEREQSADFDPAETADGKPADAEGESLEDIERVGDGSVGIGEEDDGQFFVWEQGTKVTLGTLVRRGIPVEHAFVFGGRRTKGTGGLMGFDEKPLMIVRGKPGPVKIVPTYDDEERVTKVTIESHVNAIVVQNADSDDGLMLISHILDKRGYAKRDAAA